LLVIGQVYTRQKEYEKALNVLADSWELFDMNNGKDSEQVGNVYLEMAAINNKKKDLKEAITF
jgi:lipopolysaccharide biosynthesis regulator YciM